MIQQLRASTDPVLRRKLSKRIAKQPRKELRSWRHLCASHLLGRFENTKFLEKIKVDMVISSACPVEPDDFADFLQSNINCRMRYPVLSIGSCYCRSSISLYVIWTRHYHSFQTCDALIIMVLSRRC